MLLTPEYIFKNVEAITPEFLRQLGVTALVLDVDNTLTGDGSQQLDDSVAAWLDAMRAAGVSLTIVSNNTAKRVRPFAARIGLAFVRWPASRCPSGCWPPGSGWGCRGGRWPWWGTRSSPTGWRRGCLASAACTFCPAPPARKAAACG